MAPLEARISGFLAVAAKKDHFPTNFTSDRPLGLQCGSQHKSLCALQGRCWRFQQQLAGLYHPPTFFLHQSKRFPPCVKVKWCKHTVTEDMLMVLQFATQWRLEWTPSHMHVPGNEGADHLAEEGRMRHPNNKKR
jgi:hypothetical protein|mmetsp:Transcript_21351/g.35313  ORF Transcript_21351/g.35313 Transcript_21351/m.35313 type:complete len:135 (+) Transcript_21351:542-946(+)